MQPITPLNSLPNDVKTVILKCLGVKDLKNVQLINHLWQTMAHKPIVWQQVAKNLNIKLVDPKNAEAEVMDYIRFHDIYEVFKVHVIDASNAFGEYLKGCNSDSQRYSAVLKYLSSEHCIGNIPFRSFLYSLANNKKTEIGVRAAKQMIKDGVLNDNSMLIGGLNLALGRTFQHPPDHAKRAIWEIVTSIIDKIKESPSASDILNSILSEYLLLDTSFGPFLDILLKAGAQPTEDSIRQAFKHDLTNRVLDYSNESTRKRICGNLKVEINSNFNFDGENMVSYDRELEQNIKLVKTISAAPPPTFGKK